MIRIFFHNIGHICRTNLVLSIALVAAFLTSLAVPPDRQWLGYFDWKTLTCLFCVLAVVGALRNIRFFTRLAQNIVKMFKTVRLSILALAYITFIGSMFIANDMALLTFLPLGYYVLSSTKNDKYAAFTFIIQNIAANLGGMLTPFGNPQNLYLYTRFSIPTGEFMMIMLLPFLVATALILICCLFVKKEKIALTEECEYKFQTKRTVLYLVLFALSIAIVFRFIPYVTGLIIIPLVLIFADRKALKDVDYGLLFTFAFFFIFAGNMSRISAVNDLMSFLLEKNTLLFSVASCQVISNVPSAVLLSRFTENYADLLRGVNIGGTGTLIASLASLITFREYIHRRPGEAAKYIGKFSLFNFGFLAVLVIICSL